MKRAPVMIENGFLERQIEFLLEIDRLKSVARQSQLISGSRFENSAEHSWHVAVMAFVLAPHANGSIDVNRVIKMLLVHDIVEIDAGDTFAYDTEGRSTQPMRERQAADRLFGLLPPDQAGEIRDLWDEFEQVDTPESRFANAIDRFMPLLHNYYNRGGAWRAHGIDEQQVVERVSCIGNGSKVIWEYARSLIADAVGKAIWTQRPAS